MTPISRHRRTLECRECDSAKPAIERAITHHVIEETTSRRISMSKSQNVKKNSKKKPAKTMKEKKQAKRDKKDNKSEPGIPDNPPAAR
jgi:hypothetical protein